MPTPDFKTSSISVHQDGTRPVSPALWPWALRFLLSKKAAGPTIHFHPRNGHGESAILNFTLAQNRLFGSQNTGCSRPKQIPTLLSTDVRFPPNLSEKRHRTYLIWEYGKRPDLVVEVVSNIDRHEERKLKGYAELGIPYYVIHDPEGHLSDRVLRAYELHGGSYVELVKPWFEDLGIGLTLWDGVYRDYEDTFIRWCDPDGALLLTGVEKVAREKSIADENRQQAHKAAQLAERERHRAEAAEEKARHLEARLKELGEES